MSRKILDRAEIERLLMSLLTQSGAFGWVVISIDDTRYLQFVGDPSGFLLVESSGVRPGTVYTPDQTDALQEFGFALDPASGNWQRMVQLCGGIPFGDRHILYARQLIEALLTIVHGLQPGQLCGVEIGA